MKVYIASASAYAPAIDLIQDLFGTNFQFLSDWPEGVMRGDSEDAKSANAFWARDLAQIREADAVILTCASAYRLRGAIFELGYALALNKIVIVVGDHPDFHTWQFAPGITKVRTIEDAFKVLTYGYEIVSDAGSPLHLRPTSPSAA